MTVTEILRQLPSLSTDELQSVKAKATAALSLSTGFTSRKETKSETRDDYLLSGICYELRRRGLLASSRGFLGQDLPPKFKEASKVVRGYLERYLGTASSVELTALGHLVARALADKLEASKIPITPRTMLSNVEQIPTALDLSYPGYLKAGLLSFCWRQRG